MAKDSVLINDPAFLDENSDEFADVMNVPDPDKSPDADTETTEQDVEGASSSASDESTEKADDLKTEKVEKPADDAPKGVETKDGGSIIPYSVLEKARTDGAMNAEQLQDTREQLEAAQKQIQDLQTQVTAGTETGDDAGAGGESTNKLVEKLAALKEDFPEFGEIAEVFTTQIKGLTDELTELKDERKAETIAVIKDQQRDAREVMDTNPHLLLWESTDKEAYRRAYETDQRLKVDPLFKDLPLKERFDKVVEMVVLEYPDAQRVTVKQPAEKVTGKESNEDLADKANKALEDAGLKGPETLSDIPGGGLVDDAKSVTDLSPLQLESLFEGKSDEWVSQFLDKHTA